MSAFNQNLERSGADEEVTHGGITFTLWPIKHKDKETGGWAARYALAGSVWEWADLCERGEAVAMAAFAFKRATK